MKTMIAVVVASIVLFWLFGRHSHYVTPVNPSAACLAVDPSNVCFPFNLPDGTYAFPHEMNH